MCLNKNIIRIRSFFRWSYIAIIMLFQCISFIQSGYAQSEKSDVIDNLLKLAREDIKVEHLMTPKHSNAYEKLKKVLSLEPNNQEVMVELNKIIDIYIKLAEEKMTLGNLKLALKYLDRANTINPNDNRISVAREKLNVYELLKLARKDIEANHLMKPAQSNAYEKLKKVLLIAPDNQEAMAELNKIIEIYIKLAEEKMALGNLKLALKYLDRAIIINPNDNRISAAREKLKVYELLKLARKDIEANQLMKPAQSNAYEKLKKVLLIDPDNQEAMAELSKIIEIYIKLAEEQMDLSNLKLALKYLDRANTINPNDNRISAAREKLEVCELLTLARKDIEANQLTKPAQSNAYEKLKKVLSLSPNNKDAKTELSKMIDKLIQLSTDASDSGNWFQAKFYLNQAQKIIPDDERIKIAQKQLQAPKKVNVIELLNHAKADIKLKRLTSPPENNALEKFRKILTLDPNNEAALDGLNRLLDIHLQYFEKFLSSGDWAKAEYYINQANFINQNDRRVEEGLKKIEKFKVNHIKHLLNLARTDIMNKRLTTPLGENAYEKLQEILSLDSNNNDAKAELSRIVGVYIQFSEKSMSENNRLNAKKYIDQAEKILPDDSRISKKRAKLKSLNTGYIESQLRLAKNNLERKRLKEAALNFKSVLTLDVDNTEAINGLKKIVDNYIVLANNNMSIGDWAKAKTFLNKVDIVLPGDKRVIAIRNKMKEWQKVSINYKNFIQSNQFMIVKISSDIKHAEIISSWLRDKKIEYIELCVHNENDFVKFRNMSYFFLDKRKKDLNSRDKLLLKNLTANNYILYFFPTELNVSAIINQMPEDEKLLNNGIKYISVVYRDSNRPTGFNNLSSYYLFSPSFQVKYSKKSKVDKIVNTLTSLNLKSDLIEKNQKNLIYTKFDFVEAQGVKVNIQSLISKLEECDIVEFATPFKIAPR